MNQYEFSITKNDHYWTVCCTAKSESIARDAVANSYGTEFKINESVAVHPPHHYFAEIDASTL